MLNAAENPAVPSFHADPPASFNPRWDIETAAASLFISTVPSGEVPLAAWVWFYVNWMQCIVIIGAIPSAMIVIFADSPIP